MSNLEAGTSALWALTSICLKALIPVLKDKLRHIKHLRVYLYMYHSTQASANKNSPKSSTERSLGGNFYREKVETKQGNYTLNPR